MIEIGAVLFCAVVCAGLIFWALDSKQLPNHGQKQGFDVKGRVKVSLLDQ